MKTEKLTDWGDCCSDKNCSKDICKKSHGILTIEEIRVVNNANLISDFMVHCKEEGISIPDSMFESFFNA